MKSIHIKIPVEIITGWESFHRVFAETLGFPEYYGRNMDAWIDCMSSVDRPEEGMTKITTNIENRIVLDLGDCTGFAKRCPEQYEAILDSTGFVNYRRIESGEEPILMLSFWNREPLQTKC